MELRTFPADLSILGKHFCAIPTICVNLSFRRKKIIVYATKFIFRFSYPVFFRNAGAERTDTEKNLCESGPLSENFRAWKEEIVFKQKISKNALFLIKFGYLLIKSCNLLFCLFFR